MQRRTATAVTAVTATAAGLALLANFETPSRGAAGAGAAPAAEGGGSSQTVTGPVESNRWGDVQVAVTVEGGRITDVSLVQVPSSHGRSVEINDAAVPILEQETLAAQSADIDMVSGATDTSEGYIASLQAALDSLGR